MKTFEEFNITEAVENPVMDFFNDLDQLKKIYNQVKTVIIQQGHEIVPSQNRLLHAEKQNGSHYGGLALFIGASKMGGTTVETAKLNPKERIDLEDALREVIDTTGNSKFNIYVEEHGVRLSMNIHTIGTY